VAHAATVHFVPLIDLATTAQSKSAILTREELNRLLHDIDREFIRLTNLLDRFRVSTGHA
jgi:hypothetical protein